MNRPEIEDRLREAVAIMFERDRLLLEYDVGERAIAAKLACYLAPLFPDHDVDVEYNRHGLDPKAVQLPPECHGGGEKLIVPDVIVHRRGHDADNLLVVEVKKEPWRRRESNPRPKTFGERVYILVRFRFVWYATLKEPASWVEHEPVEIRLALPGQRLEAILQKVTPFN